MLREQLSAALSAFTKNVDSVNELMRFDSLVLEFAVQHLESLQQRLTAVHGAENSRLNVTNTLAMLKSIRKNHSLEPHYRQMLNQCNVLLVSYFSSAAGDIFRAGVTDAVRHRRRPNILKEDIKINLRDIPEIGTELIERAGELLLDSRREINLQNMQSIAVAFRDYFEYDRKQDETVNDIILSHACRHVIVHCGGVADRKMVGQLRSAHPRTLKPEVRETEHIQFTEDEIAVVGTRMVAYLQDLAVAVET